ncbi:contact-dependent growth inhibition system immunity protein [Enemella sp. A6]|uniref:contact-dependent growth inhibition system immunity protein n=1 Tax=Enemella sp. A6 TaxID=3440152 RepID=UPI003EB71EB3
MQLTSAFPELAQLVGGGFNQDYEDVFGTPHEVISQFTSSPVFCARLPQEVERLEAEHSDDIDEVLAALGNGYDYEAAGLSAKEWLDEVLAQVRSEAPPVDQRYSGLLGQQVLGVSSDSVPTLVLERDVVEFPLGVSCAAPGGVDEIRPHGAPALLRELVGERVVCAVETRGRLTVATPHVRVYSLTGEGEGFIVRPA